MRTNRVFPLAVWLCVVFTLLSSVCFAAQQTAPPRDHQPSTQTGTSVIQGRVVASDTGRPLRRARLTVAAPELGGTPRTTSTDADGRYRVPDLPAGQYTVTVSRSGYLTLHYGQRRPLEPGKPLDVFDKQVVDRVDFLLPPMGVISGRISDEVGDPIEGVTVVALRSRYWEGRRQLVPTGQRLTQSDDAGQFRILGLAPGQYYVMASTRETWAVTVGGVSRVMGYAPTYFPGTTASSEARRLTLALGQEASNTDFSLIAGRAAVLSGRPRFSGSALHQRQSRGRDPRRRLRLFRGKQERHGRRGRVLCYA